MCFNPYADTTYHLFRKVQRPLRRFPLMLIIYHLEYPRLAFKKDNGVSILLMLDNNLSPSQHFQVVRCIKSFNPSYAG